MCSRAQFCSYSGAPLGLPEAAAAAASCATALHQDVLQFCTHSWRRSRDSRAKMVEGPENNLSSASGRDLSGEEGRQIAHSTDAKDTPGLSLFDSDELWAIDAIVTCAALGGRGLEIYLYRMRVDVACKWIPHCDFQESCMGPSECTPHP